MKLPHAHRYGASKARFFMAFGFRPEAWGVFADALRSHGMDNEVARMKETGFGPRYEVDGPMSAPDGRRPAVRTIWQVDQGTTAPRLITAHPLEGNP